MKIKVKLFDGQTMPEIIDKGEWIDLSSNANIEIKGPNTETYKTSKGVEKTKVVFNNTMIPLGVAMKLPKGFEAVVLPRSSTYKKTKTILANMQGVIDGSYSGNNDQWWYNAISLSTCHIKKGDRIAQFRIQLSQKATIWQKLRWLFSCRIKLVQVDSLDNNNRGGFGSTDVKEGK